MYGTVMRWSGLGWAACPVNNRSNWIGGELVAPTAAVVLVLVLLLQY